MSLVPNNSEERTELINYLVSRWLFREIYDFTQEHYELEQRLNNIQTISHDEKSLLVLYCNPSQQQLKWAVEQQRYDLLFVIGHPRCPKHVRTRTIAHVCSQWTSENDHLVRAWMIHLMHQGVAIGYYAWSDRDQFAIRQLMDFPRSFFPFMLVDDECDDDDDDGHQTLSILRCLPLDDPNRNRLLTEPQYRESIKTVVNIPFDGETLLHTLTRDPNVRRKGTSFFMDELRRLLCCGADPNIRDQLGYTIIHHICKLYKWVNQLNVIEWVLTYSTVPVDLTLTDPDDRSPILLCLMNNLILKDTMRFGEYRCLPKTREYILKGLYEMDCVPLLRNVHRSCPSMMQMLVADNFYEAVEWLLEKYGGELCGVNRPYNEVDEEEVRGCLLQIAIEILSTTIEDRIRMIQLLMKHGAQLETESFSAVHFAVTLDQPKCVHFFLQQPNITMNPSRVQFPALFFVTTLFRNDVNADCTMMCTLVAECGIHPSAFCLSEFMLYTKRLHEPRRPLIRVPKTFFVPFVNTFQDSALALDWSYLLRCWSEQDFPGFYYNLLDLVVALYTAGYWFCPMMLHHELGQIPLLAYFPEYPEVVEFLLDQCNYGWDINATSHDKRYNWLTSCILFLCAHAKMNGEKVLPRLQVVRRMIRKYNATLPPNCVHKDSWQQIETKLRGDDDLREIIPLLKKNAWEWKLHSDIFYSHLLRVCFFVRGKKAVNA